MKVRQVEEMVWEASLRHLASAMTDVKKIENLIMLKPFFVQNFKNIPLRAKRVRW